MTYAEKTNCDFQFLKFFSLLCHFMVSLTMHFISFQRSEYILFKIISQNQEEKILERQCCFTMTLTQSYLSVLYVRIIFSCFACHLSPHRCPSNQKHSCKVTSSIPEPHLQKEDAINQQSITCDVSL